LALDPSTPRSGARETGGLTAGRVSHQRLRILRDRGRKADGGQRLLNGFDRWEASDPHTGVGRQQRGSLAASRFVGQDRAVIAYVAGECNSVGHLCLILPIGSYEQVSVVRLIVVWKLIACVVSS